MSPALHLCYLEAFQRPAECSHNPNIGQDEGVSHLSKADKRPALASGADRSAPIRGSHPSSYLTSVHHLTARPSDKPDRPPCAASSACERHTAYLPPLQTPGLHIMVTIAEWRDPVCSRGCLLKGERLLGLVEAAPLNAVMDRLSRASRREGDAAYRSAHHHCHCHLARHDCPQQSCSALSHLEGLPSSQSPQAPGSV